jgi:hypothetical protein
MVFSCVPFISMLSEISAVLLQRKAVRISEADNLDFPSSAAVCSGCLRLLLQTCVYFCN